MFWNKSNKPGWYGSRLNNYGMALESGDYSAIPWVFCVFAENHSVSKTLAADILCAALQKMTFDDLVRVDEQMRQTTSMEWRIDWRRLSLDSFFTDGMNESVRRAVVVVASFNPNGFIRERAVRMMKDFSGTLPFVVLRQNDWVTQVRYAANEAADYRLSHLTEGELIAALPFADKLSRSGRMQNAEAYIKRIHAVLTSKDNEAELNAGLSSDSIRTRRICTFALLCSETPRYDLAVRRLKRETDPFLRASVFRKLMSAGQDLYSVAEQFLKDRYPLNRALALEYICGINPNNALKTATQLLLDKNAAVRERARYYLNLTAPEFDYSAYYQSHLDDSTVPALLGLGETGAVGVAADMEDYLRSEKTAVVRAAMTALMSLDCENYAAAMTGFLSDDRTGVVKTACKLIVKTAEPDYTKVWEIFRATPFINTKRKCFAVLLMASKWQRLLFILDVLEIGGNEMRERADNALNRWLGNCNQSYIAANPAQIKRITESIRRLKGILSESTQSQLLFLLR